MGLLDGKVALVTGAAGSIGSETALALAEQGARVVLTDLRAPELQAVTEGLRTQGYDVACQAGDITSEDDIRAVVGFAIETFGGVDILDNNAGATGYSSRDLDIPDMSVELWDQVLSINARAPMLFCKYAIPSMLERGGGSIINISSGQSLSGDVSNFAYAASKAAVNSLTRHMATGYSPRGIRVNAIAAGLIIQPGMEQRLPAHIQKIFLSHCLVPRLGTPRDIANMVVFLASDLSSYVTGQILSVDGGFTAHLPNVADMRPIIDGMKKAPGQWS
ncbi:NADP-dependent 7-alpha-hydroxysteroid dehydrogenase [Brevundimonas sp. NIBR10]|uniref:SDR family NAD(P)-dependent oxidoreductase n=1 Tax=Brevundimonas sp. NIBR10 TaxID=3015997 RepID=UPI0022F158DE|nr:SDR family NAD(P)-dependent oxidoreductase [Brevundimonas sp. NIBR10]WGM47298.1 NADP-dependent 7-alpha-hydroxysteroid dehydrogenase [Brevundimonas sp. NIBR10]